MKKSPASCIEHAAVLADMSIELLSSNTKANATNGRVCMLLTYLIGELKNAHDALAVPAIATDQVGAPEGLLH